MLKNKRMF